jgi:NAD(P)H-hydrate epimerase
MKVSRVSEMRALDTKAIEQFGIMEELLMENAGEAVYFVLLKEIGITGKRFVVLCGGGNNGGDGLVIARKIHSVGGAVKVFILGDPSKYKGARHHQPASRGSGQNRICRVHQTGPYPL